MTTRKITGNKNNFGLHRCNSFTFQNFCKLFESLRLSITSTNGNRPKACFSNAVSPYFGRVCKVSHTDKLRYRVQPATSCSALLSTGRASALAMTWVWFLYLEKVENEIRKAKYPIESRLKWPITCVSHICGFFDFRGIRWPLAFPGHFHRYIHHYINKITVLVIFHGYKHYFDAEILRFDEVCLDALLTFFFKRASWDESVICKLAIKWYLMRMCTSWLCSLKQTLVQNNSAPSF